MSSQYTLKINPEQAKEMPMVDLAFEVLKAVNSPFYYRDLMQEIARVKGISDDEVMQVIAQLYTEINIDGRFACVGNNRWGLKRWYPVEKADDAMGGGKRPRIINDDDDDLDDDDLFAEEEDDAYHLDDEDDYDVVDEDRAELFEDEVEEVTEEVDEELEEDLGESEDVEEDLDGSDDDEDDDEDLDPELDPDPDPDLDNEDDDK